MTRQVADGAPSRRGARPATVRPMTDHRSSPAARASLPTAAELAASVRAGQRTPVEVVREALARIAALDGQVGAFVRVRAERALAEAAALAHRPDLATLPLAGVPVAVKDNLPVEGEPMGMGAATGPRLPAAVDHPAVGRLRSAGAVIVGLTRLPELGIFPFTDGPAGTARNPWDLARSPGGSSGGSAAAVAAGLVPLALGNDGLGSIRIPAACCGVVGVKPGRGVVPAEVGVHSWYGLTENGPLATTVEDAALMLEALAGGGLAGAAVRAATASDAGAVADGPWRVALAVRSPAVGVPVAPAWRQGAERAAAVLAGAGHQVTRADDVAPIRDAVSVLATWVGAVADEVDALARAGGDPWELEPRTRRHAALGRVAHRRGLVREADRTRWRERQLRFFDRFDLLVTPTLARGPLPADGWSARGWLATLQASLRLAPFTGGWNVAGFPALTVPAGHDAAGLPLGVQLVAPPGGEVRLLAAARLLEREAPWPRHAPLARSVG